MLKPFAFRNCAPTAAVQARCDLRDLAAIAMYYATTGDMPRTKSALIGRITRDLRDYLIALGEMEPIESTADAEMILATLGFTNMRRGRNHREFRQQIYREAMARELGDAPRPFPLSEEECDAIREMTSESLDEMEDSKGEAESEIQKTLAMLDEQMDAFIEESEKSTLRVPRRSPPEPEE